MGREAHSEIGVVSKSLYRNVALSQETTIAAASIDSSKVLTP